MQAEFKTCQKASSAWQIVRHKTKARMEKNTSVHTEGETLAEVRRNMRDALSLAVNYLKSEERERPSLEITIG